MAVLVNGSEIVLSGTVGDLFWDDCFTASDVIVALAQVGRGNDVTIRLNSGGGIATEGAAIHSALMAHKGRKTIIVEGIAASAASVIAMAADERVMALGAIMMIHDPSGFTFGTVAEHEKQIEALTALATAMAGIYADRTGRTVDQARADMREEIWLTPEQAVEQGYADRIQGRAANDDQAPVQPTAFDFKLYAHPPERLVALADHSGWIGRPRPSASAPSSRSRQQEIPMPNDPKAGDTPVAKTYSQAELDAAVAGGRNGHVARTDASQIAKLCVDGGVPAMAATLLSEGVSLDEAKTRINAAGEIKNMVASARRKDPTIPEDLAATMLAEGKTVEQARSALFDKLVANEQRHPTSSHIPAGGADGKSGGGQPAKVDLVADMKRRHGDKA